MPQFLVVRSREQVVVIKAPLPQLLELQAAMEFRELLKEMGAPPEEIPRQLALLRAERQARRQQGTSRPK